MPTCAKCGKEVEAAATVCICGATVEQARAAASADVRPEQVPGAAGEPPPRLSLGQRVLAGARTGALTGALYGGAYGLVMWIVLSAMAEMEDRFAALFQMVLTSALIVGSASAALGALYRLVVAPKPKDAAKLKEEQQKDTKFDRS